MSIPTLGAALQMFLIDHLDIQRGLRRSSIRSYRDTLRLFLQYVSKTSGKPITKLSLNDLTSDILISGRVLDCR